MGIIWEIESKQELAKEARNNELSKQGVDEKPINPKSKGCSNLGRGNPKDLAKA